MRTYNGDISKIERYTRPVLEEWLLRNNIPYDTLVLGKPWAGPRGFYIDDKAMLPEEFVGWVPSTLIVPLCGRATRYPQGLPKYLYSVNGEPMLAKALQGINIHTFERKVFVVLAEHVEEYDVCTRIRQIVPDATFVILDDHTSCQSETVVCAIESADITGQITIRDCDNHIRVHSIPKGNSVAGYELRYGSTPESHANKCFLVTEKDSLRQIAEKKPISSVFGCGLYTFAEASDFVRAYASITKDGETYISDVVAELLKDQPFRYIQSDTFLDWGTIDDYNRI